MPYIEFAHGMLHSGLAGKIALNYHVAQIPVYHHLFGKKVENRSLLEAAIRTPNPENLLCRVMQAGNEIGRERRGLDIQARLSHCGERRCTGCTDRSYPVNWLGKKGCEMPSCTALVNHGCLNRSVETENAGAKRASRRFRGQGNIVSAHGFPTRPNWAPIFGRVPRMGNSELTLPPEDEIQQIKKSRQIDEPSI